MFIVHDKIIIAFCIKWVNSNIAKMYHENYVQPIIQFNHNLNYELKQLNFYYNQHYKDEYH